MVPVFGGAGKNINVAKTVVGGVKRIGTVEQRLELAAHLIVINRRSEGDDIGIVHLGHDGRSIVGNDATTGLLTGKTSLAKPDFLVSEREFFHVVP